MRDELCAALQQAYPEGWWRTELRIPKDGEEFIADVAGYLGQRGKQAPAVAIEVQCSTYKPDYIAKKTRFYAANKIHVLWVVPLRAPLGTEVFRPRLWELYLHTMYLGYVFYYEPGANGILLPVHFARTYREIPSRSFFASQGEEEYFEVYTLRYKTLRQPVAGDPIDVSRLKPRVEEAWPHPNNPFLNQPHRMTMGTPQKQWWRKDAAQPGNVSEAVRKFLPNYDPNDEFDDDGEY